MEECDEIKRRGEAHSRLVTIYRTEPITLTEHLIRARCSHLSPLGAGMEEFALCALPCFSVLSHICCFLHVCLSWCISFSFSLPSMELLLLFILLLFSNKLGKSLKGVLATWCETRSSQSETGRCNSLFSVVKQTADDILDWPCIEYVNY